MGGSVAYDSSLLVQRPTQRVHAYYMLCFVVPRAVFPPVVRGDFFPGVAELVCRLEKSHGAASSKCMLL